jgi:hypothetical protein
MADIRDVTSGWGLEDTFSLLEFGWTEYTGIKLKYFYSCHILTTLDFS